MSGSPGKAMRLPSSMICSWVHLGFTLIVYRPWEKGHASSKIRQPAIHPSCNISTHTPRVFNTSNSEISFKFKTMGRNGQGVKSNSTRESQNHSTPRSGTQFPIASSTNGRKFWWIISKRTTIFVLKLMLLQTRRIKDFRSSTTMPGVMTVLNLYGSFRPSMFLLVWYRS